MPKKLTTEEFIQRAKHVHGERYDYSKINYKTSYIKIEIICNKHGSFLQLPVHHLHGFGCKECSGNKKQTIESFKEAGIRIHGNKYDYSKLGSYKDNKTNLEVICPQHKSFFISFNSHISKRNGCPECSGKCIDTAGFIKKAKIIHGDLYNYDETNYINNRTSIIIICKIHGKFLQRVGDHIKGSGCPNCKLSKGENKIRQWLRKNNVEFTSQATFKNCTNPNTNRKLRFDFYILKYNILIEFDGRQHSELISTSNFHKESLKNIQFRDNIKNKYASDNNIKLIRINYTQLNQTENILEKELDICLTK